MGRALVTDDKRAIKVIQSLAQLHGFGLAPLDAAHLALAEGAACDVLLTCDDRFEKRGGRIASRTRVVNLVQWDREQDHEPTSDRE